MRATPAVRQGLSSGSFRQPSPKGPSTQRQAPRTRTAVPLRGAPHADPDGSGADPHPTAKRCVRPPRNKPPLSRIKKAKFPGKNPQPSPSPAAKKGGRRTELREERFAAVTASRERCSAASGDSQQLAAGFFPPAPLPRGPRAAAQGRVCRWDRRPRGRPGPAPTRGNGGQPQGQRAQPVPGGGTTAEEGRAASGPLPADLSAVPAGAIFPGSLSPGIAGRADGAERTGAAAGGRGGGVGGGDGAGVAGTARGESGAAEQQLHAAAGGKCGRGARAAFT